MTRKKPDWQKQLSLYLARVRRLPFRYGEHDCALFAAGAVQAMTGEDPAAPWRGRYRSLREGLSVIGEGGFRDHIAVAQELLDRIPVERMRKGDLAVIETDAGPALGIVGGPFILCLREDGLAQLPLDRATSAMRV